MNIRFRHSCLFSPGPVGVEVLVGVNVCVNVCVGTGLQVIPPGLGVHWPSLPHTAVISPSRTNPGSHWNTTTEPSVVLGWGCNRDPLIGGGGAPQLAARRIEVTIAMTSYQSTSNMHWIVPTSWLQNGINRFVVYMLELECACFSWNTTRRYSHTRWFGILSWVFVQLGDYYNLAASKAFVTHSSKKYIWVKIHFIAVKEVLHTY